MTRIGFAEFRRNLAAHFDAVAVSRDPLVVTRRKGASMVVLSENEYDAIKETLHLLRSAANAAHVMASIAELDREYGVERDLPAQAE